MNTWSSDAITALPKRYRANLINGITGFKPAVLVGTCDDEKNTNLALISSIFHIGASPALLGMIIRPSPEGTERHTLENILATGCYTVNHITLAMADRAHQTSARYPRTASEFEATGLGEEWREGFNAPFVAESPISLGIVFAEHQPLTINGTHLLIGNIDRIHCAEHLIREDGSVDLADAHSVVAAGLDGYHEVKPGIRFAYAKADTPPTRVT